MGFWSVVGDIGKGILGLAGVIVEEKAKTLISAAQYRDMYNNSDMSEDEMLARYNKTSDKAEKMGILASMKDKGYRE